MARTKNTQDEINNMRPMAMLITVLAVLTVIALLLVNIIKPIPSLEDMSSIVAENISFETDSIELAVDEQYIANITIEPANVTSDEIIFTSDDVNIVRVDQSGTIIAVSVGETSVIAFNTTSGLFDELFIKVVAEHETTTGTEPAETTAPPTTETTVPTETTTAATTSLTPNPTAEVTGITLSFYSTSIRIGERVMPLVTMTPWGASNKAELWSSSDPSIAKVDKYGTIEGVAPGTCAITVASVDNPAVTATVNVTVSSVSIIEGITFMEGIMIVNKSYSIPAGYAPGDLDPTCSTAFWYMQQASKADGISLWVQSGYRSYSTQSSIYNRNVNNSGLAAADTFSARPGYSEHQTGFAIDCNVVNDSFAGTPAAIWLEENCWKYGFIIRYPEDKTEITGYKYEPWHIRYVGEDIAAKLHESGQCLEEYFGITSEYAD